MTLTPLPAATTLDAGLLLVERQLGAIDSWHAAGRLTEQSASLRARTREQRMDVARRIESLREEHRVIIERTQRSLQLSLQRVREPRRPTVLLAHRNSWLTGQLVEALTDGGAEGQRRREHRSAPGGRCTGHVQPPAARR